MTEIVSKDFENYFKGKDWVHQLGFCAPDWRQFMIEHNKLFGSGPFFYTTNTFGKLLYHGEEVDCTGLEFHASYGAWGSHSIEVVTQNDWSIPTMFTELNKQDEPGLNHVHIFVDSLAEAQEACDFYGIPVITVGYPDLENALEKARATGADEEMVRANAGKPSFMVADMRKKVGFAVQFIEPRAKRLHDAILGAKDKWDGNPDHMFIPMGGK